ncbi:MAG TPA: hypothetical protein VD927_03875 [Chryseosolibacter sp.]|nr:hypothetical protein [Chryseosolibacter sp.]
MKTSYLAILALLFILTNCKDEDPDPCTGYFYDKPLENVKHCLQGKWQMHYYIFGFTFERIPLEDYYFTITKSDSVIFEKAQVVIRDKIKWSPITDMRGNKTYTLEFDYFGDGIYRYQFAVEGIHAGDTLVLFENAADGNGYFFTRLD